MQQEANKDKTKLQMILEKKMNNDFSSPTS